MDEERAKKKIPEPTPVLPPADRPAIAPAAQQAFAPGGRQAIASADIPAIAPADRQAIAPGPAPSSLPESGQPALPSGASAAPDPLKDVIEAILRPARTIAVVGASDKPGKPSHRVSFYLMQAGFEVFPVNPALRELGGRPAFPDLRSVPKRIDIVDIFRRPETVLSVVEEAIAVGARAVWMQEGIINEEAAARARSAGLAVVMDRCVMKEHRRMNGEKAGPEPISGVLPRSP